MPQSLRGVGVAREGSRLLPPRRKINEIGRPRGKPREDSLVSPLLRGRATRATSACHPRSRFASGQNAGHDRRRYQGTG
jgi:hypothetical protein